MENKPEDIAESSSLETPETVVGAGNTAPQSPASTPKKKASVKIRNLISKLNIYLLLFIFILLLAGMLIFVGAQRAQRELAQPGINTTPLSPEALGQLRGTDASVGDPKQTLTIESNSIFTGSVLIRDNLEVAGEIKVGGALNLPGITVAGTSSFDQIQANSLSIAGDTNIQGALAIQGTLTVSGGATFGGPISAPQINTQNLQISGDLIITRHIDAGGGTPGITNGNALGAGGTASVSGTDTAGTLTVNTGGGPGAGCFATISFAQNFNGTPHVVITPVGPTAAGLNYYINRSTANFTICTTNSAPAGSNFSFDYIAID